jgi:alpha-galactosidase
MKTNHGHPVILLMALFMLVSAGTLNGQTDNQIRIHTDHTDLIFVSGADGRLYQAYFGPALNQVPEFKRPVHVAYATYGTDNLFEPAIRMTHTDGNPSLELVVTGHQAQADADGALHTQIPLKDPVYPVELVLHFRAHPAEDVIEEWTEIVHHEAKPVMLYNYASGMLHFDADHYWLTQFHGDWAEEMKMQDQELTSGIKIIDSKLGSRAHMYQTPVFLLSLGGKSGENSGEVLAGTLGWSGNFRFLFEIDEKNSLRVIPGINPFASEYQLQPGKTFTTPVFIFTYSNQGRGQASRNLHHWALKSGVLDAASPRYTLLNNWETTYFSFDEPKLTALLDDTKKLGLDMFLLDDGWFANKYPRNDDRAGLGDWVENKSKLPDGLGYLVKEADTRGVKFGLWIEPEMVNPRSELYEKHPEWILKLPNRPENYFRNQLVLDLTNPAVQDFVYQVVDGLMSKYPGIAFFKWDCNRMMTNVYSPYLKNEQSHVYIEYVRGLYAVLDRIRQKYPHLPMMLCSGGGGRVDYGALKYFTEFWASDNTDAVERVYIQWGYSHFFPAIAVCNHITSWGKQSLKFRTDVAMMGKMGYDIPVHELSDKELAFSQEAVKNYGRLEDVIWRGDLYRLVSPWESNRAVLMSVSAGRDRAVLFSYTLNARFGETFEPVRLQGLDPEKTYTVKEINKFPGMRSVFFTESATYSGDFLMKNGIPVTTGEALSSAVFEITVK